MNKREECRGQVQDWLTEWFLARNKIDAISRERLGGNLRDADYFEAGWLTSMEVVELVTEIERRFEMQFSEADLQDPRFVTITGLSDLVLERTPQVSESR
jgi:acyl carrier protein